MSSLSVFSQAAHYTLDPNLQAILQGCVKGKYPSQFKVVKGKIITLKGNTFELSRDPMEVCNLIHDIINGQEKSPRTPIQSSVLGESRRSSRTSRSAGSAVGVSDDAIYSFAKRETRRLKKDDYHEDQLRSCIFTAIMFNYISATDFIVQNEKIISINGINTEKPCIEITK